MGWWGGAVGGCGANKSHFNQINKPTQWFNNNVFAPGTHQRGRLCNPLRRTRIEDADVDNNGQVLMESHVLSRQTPPVADRNWTQGLHDASSLKAGLEVWKWIQCNVISFSCQTSC